MRNDVPSKGLEWTNLILGAGLACAAIMFVGLPAAAWNAGIVGSLIVCSSAVALYRYGDWAEWSNLTLGCWAAVAPFLLGFGSAQGPMWTHVLIGICVGTFAALQLVASRRAPSSTN
ncbi:SPW repeat protein [Mesorhizobium captivum]|uniref:SPW repeat protein n=1 Tax=Mesorhizobium captivum TaxID=3072319 RepID=UPI002A23F470|nr:SPW repeat protein [Mesorhizobium sp. VK3C]MDX8448250.1 SPW repeat protein [Mesorhizobium sp. VK3C]